MFSSKIPRTCHVFTRLFTSNTPWYFLDFAFYENLYTSKNIDSNDIVHYLNEVNCPTLTQCDKDMCDAIPTMDDCKAAVNYMKNDKSPRSDGISSEFYKCFWNSIDKLFYDVLLTVYGNKELSFFQRLSIITLLFQIGDRCDFKRYRPLSLTNTDYKLIAFILANRLQRVVDRLIGNEQSAYIKGRYIGENARILFRYF